MQVRTERGMYHFRSAAASSDAMSTVIDGADQAQYGLPYFAQDKKSTTNGLKYKVWTINCSVPGYLCKDAICLHCVPVFDLQLQTRLCAALVHGEFANTYLFSGNMPSGTNAVVEVIHRSFVTLWCLTNRLPFVNTHCCFATALQNSSCIH